MVQTTQAMAILLQFVSFLIIITSHNVLQIDCKSMSHTDELTDGHSFQDLSPTQVEEDVGALRTGSAPVIQPLRSSNHSRKNGNVLWGFEQKWVQLMCNVNASPVAEFTWKYRGQDIVSTGRDTLLISNQDNLSILKVKVQESNLGEYTCRSSNELGASEMNYFVRRAAKPLTPDFDTVVVPSSGILVEVKAFNNHHRRHLHILQTRGFKDREELGEILPIKGYIIQMRKMRSCDDWRNITMHSEKKFLRHHLIPGTIYRMRMATQTRAGHGEFSRAKTVNYRLPDPISDSEEDPESQRTTTSLIADNNNEEVFSSEIIMPSNDTTSRSLEEEYSDEDRRNSSETVII